MENTTDDSSSSALKTNPIPVSNGRVKKEFLPRKSNTSNANGLERPRCSSGQGFSEAQVGIKNLTVNSAVAGLSNGFVEDIYGEIGTTLANGLAPNIVSSVVEQTKPIDSETIEEPNMNCGVAERPLSSHVEAYILRPKRRRHVYHEITLPFERKPEESGVRSNNETLIDGKCIPPPVPFKPHYLRSKYGCTKPSDSSFFPPPLPPRAVNKEAILQRKQLTEEYFENIRKSIDAELADEFIENDLPALPYSPTGQTDFRFPNDEGASTSRAVQDPPYWTIDDDPVSHNRRRSIPLLDNSEKTPAQLEKNNHCNSRNEKTVPGLHYDPRMQLLQSLKCLKQCGWYWGNMSWEDAEAMLNLKPNVEGAFLVRDSQDPLHLLTLTVRSVENSIHHVRIEHSEGKFHLYEPSGSVSRGAANCVRHPNIVTFIKLVIKQSRSGTFIYFVKTRNMGEPPVQIRLLAPISRFSCVKSLKYYTRFVIKELVPNESIGWLPIPAKLKDYLRASQYFDKDEDFACALAS